MLWVADQFRFPALTPRHRVARTPDELALMVRCLQSAPERCFDFETNGLRYANKDKHPIGYGLGYIASDGLPYCWYVPVAHQTADQMAPHAAAKQAFEDALRGAESLIGHNLKYDLNVARAAGWFIDEDITLHDTMVQAYLIFERRRFRLESLAKSVPGCTFWDVDEMIQIHDDFTRERAKARKMTWKKDNPNIYKESYLSRYGHAEVPVALESEYCCRDVAHALLLDAAQRTLAQGHTPQRAYLYNNEMLLVRALADMEYEGQEVDAERLVGYADFLDCDLERRETELEMAFGARIDWANNNQLRDLLFGHLKITPLKHTREGLPAVDRESLLMIRDQHPGIAQISEYALRTKVRSVYTHALVFHQCDDLKIHCSFQQCGTVSGRLSCVASWTPITTQRGEVPVSDLRSGDRVWTHKKRWRSVRSVFTKGIERMYDVRFSTGHVLTCTMSHRLLCSDGEWRTLHECVKALGIEVGERGSCDESVPQDVEDHPADRGGVGNDVPQCSAHDQSEHPGGRTPGSEGSPVFGIQGWGSEPDEGEDGGGSPQLEGSVQGWLRLPDLSSQGTEGVRSSVGHGASFGTGTVGLARNDGHPSHRWESDEQRSGQSRIDDQGGPPNHPQSGVGHRVVSIEAIHSRGSLLVYDLEVDEDHSYLACGAFNHNSSEPNLQQIPSRNPELANPIREAFIVRPGRARIYADYSQIELRMLAWITGAHIFREAYESPAYDALCNRQISYEEYLKLRALEPEVDVHGDVAESTLHAERGAEDWKTKRSAAKIINFGVSYGMSYFGLMRNPDLHLTETEAKNYFDTFHHRTPEIARSKSDLFVKMLRRAGRGGIPEFTNWAGRTCHVPGLLSSNDAERASAQRSAFASLVQGAAGELTRFSIVALWLAKRRGKLPATATSTVHDEIQLDCDEADVVDAAFETRRSMEDQFRGLFDSTPIVADIEVTTTNWAEKKELAA